MFKVKKLFFILKNWKRIALMNK